MEKKTVRDIEVSGKKVLVRCDFNVPQDENGNITDNRRVVGALDTIRYLVDHGAKVILCSHLGRPKGEFKKEFSLAPVQKELEKANAEIEASTYEGKSGAVTAVITGESIVEKVTITDDSVLTDKELLEDMIVLALNDAFLKLAEDKNEKLGKYTGGLGGLF